MSLFQRIGDKLTQNPRRYLLISLGLNLLVGMGLIAYIVLAVLPPYTLAQTLREALAMAEEAAKEAEFSANATQDELQTRISAARNELSQRGATFLTVAEGSDIAQRLYGYAAETGVQILTLDDQTMATPDAAYQASALRLEAAGPMAQLLLFLTRIDSAAQPAAQFRDLAIIEMGEGVHRLTMNLVLYTSPYADLGGGAPTSPGPQTIPDATPESVPQLSAELSAAWVAKDWARAVTLIPRLLEYSPNEASLLERLYTARINYGYQLLDSGQEKEAAAQFLLALEVKPNGVEALDGLQRVSKTPVLSVESQRLSFKTPIASPVAVPSPTATSYLVKPDKWPTNWPWPPTQ